MTGFESLMSALGPLSMYAWTYTMEIEMLKRIDSHAQERLRKMVVQKSMQLSVTAVVTAESSPVLLIDPPVVCSPMWLH